MPPTTTTKKPIPNTKVTKDGSSEAVDNEVEDEGDHNIPANNPTKQHDNGKSNPSEVVKKPPPVTLRGQVPAISGDHDAPEDPMTTDSAQFLGRINLLRFEEGDGAQQSFKTVLKRCQDDPVKYQKIFQTAEDDCTEKIDDYIDDGQGVSLNNRAQKEKMSRMGEQLDTKVKGDANLAAAKITSVRVLWATDSRVLVMADAPGGSIVSMLLNNEPSRALLEAASMKGEAHENFSITAKSRSEDGSRLQVLAGKDLHEVTDQMVEEFGKFRMFVAYDEIRQSEKF
ncbi:hypothetical protein G7054_g6290 [Neopestalotiopsis clavispora]|nr:hypothetical protein G7054_g6290 [Neopestalotiopsis clavispora]